MKKWNKIDAILACFFIIPIVIFLGVQFFTGRNPIDIVTLLLFITSAFSVQLLLMRVMISKYVKMLPLIATLVFAAWGVWLYCTSPAWANATLGDLIIDYVSPSIGCVIACGVVKLKG